MNADLQRRVQRYGWDKAVDSYEKGWSEQLAPSQELLLEMADLQLGEDVLDVACGTGLVTFPAAELTGLAGDILGIDISGGMVDAARALATKEGVRNVRFERMDAECLDLPDRMFDVAFCSLGIMYYPSPVTALREMHRVLRPGGRAVVSVWGARQNCGWAEIFPIVDRRVRTDVCPLFFREGTGDTLRQSLTEAGFGDIQMSRISSVLHYESFADACAAAFVGGPVAMAYARFDEATKEQAHEEYRISIEPFRTGTAYNIPGEFVVGLGRRL